MGLDGEAYDGKTMKRLRANNGDITELKKQAMEELSAIGVTFLSTAPTTFWPAPPPLWTTPPS